MSTTSYIIQISDTHLFGDKNRKINGANPYLNFKSVLSNIGAYKDKSSIIIVTGDLSQDCTFESYQHLANLLNNTGIKYYFLPGNHDDLDVVNKVFDFNWVKDSVDFNFEFDDWLCCVIDTSHYPNDEGKLSQTQLLRFENVLSLNKTKRTIVFMHHHPVEINSPWMDKMILREAHEFNKIIEQNPQVKTVLFGHIHQVFEKVVNGIFYASAPSTCYQVLPNTQMFTIEKLIPGFRVIELKGDQFTSKVIWIG